MSPQPALPSFVTAWSGVQSSGVVAGSARTNQARVARCPPPRSAGTVGVIVGLASQSPSASNARPAGRPRGGPADRQRPRKGLQRSASKGPRSRPGSSNGHRKPHAQQRDTSASAGEDPLEWDAASNSNADQNSSDDDDDEIEHDAQLDSGWFGSQIAAVFQEDGEEFDGGFDISAEDDIDDDEDGEDNEEEDENGPSEDEFKSDLAFLKSIGSPAEYFEKQLLKADKDTAVRGNLWVDDDDNQDQDEDEKEDFKFFDEEVSNGRAVSTVPTHENPVEAVFGPGSFESLGLNADLCAALTESGITRPTRVQIRGIPPILGGADVVLGAATGSGKTLTYILPVIEAMKAAEALRSAGDPPLRVPRRPRCVVILPTRELAEQVLAVAKTLAHVVKFRVIGANSGGGGSGLSKLKDLFATSPVDMIVTTTGRLLQLLEAKSVDLRYTRHVIVDEVDTMFDVGFGPELRQILRAVRGRGDVVNKPQYIAAGATHPSAAEEMYNAEFPAAKRIDVDLHVPPPGLEARFIRTTAGGKIPELSSLLGECKEDGHLRGGRVIIFCNTISSARFLDHFLSESGYLTSCVHGDIPADRRSAEFNAFKNGTTQIVVCTDIAARGLDNLEIAHVILFDFPTSAVDYIHRAGRTARAGAIGRVTSLVLKRDLALARAIERASKERNDALVSARVAREEERARKVREDNDRRELERRTRMQDLEDGGRDLIGRQMGDSRRGTESSVRGRSRGRSSPTWRQGRGDRPLMKGPREDGEMPDYRGRGSFGSGRGGSNGRGRKVAGRNVQGAKSDQGANRRSNDVWVEEGFNDSERLQVGGRNYSSSNRGRGGYSARRGSGGARSGRAGGRGGVSRAGARGGSHGRGR